MSWVDRMGLILLTFPRLKKHDWTKYANWNANMNKIFTFSDTGITEIGPEMIATGSGPMIKTYVST